jgi:hypothetical protein
VSEMLALAERASQTAPPEWKHVYDRRAEIYRSGRRVKIGFSDATFTPLDEDPELVAEIEEVFREEFGREES